VEVVFLTKPSALRRPDVQRQSQRWLDRKGFPFPSVYVVPEIARTPSRTPSRSTFVIDDRARRTAWTWRSSPKARAILGLAGRGGPGAPPSAKRWVSRRAERWRRAWTAGEAVGRPGSPSISGARLKAPARSRLAVGEVDRSVTHKDWPRPDSTCGTLLYTPSSPVPRRRHAPQPTNPKGPENTLIPA